MSQKLCSQNRSCVFKVTNIICPLRAQNKLSVVKPDSCVPDQIFSWGKRMHAEGYCCSPILKVWICSPIAVACSSNHTFGVISFLPSFQAKTPREGEADLSFDSYHSTQTDLAPSLGKPSENPPLDSKPSPSVITHSSSKSTLDSDVRIQQLQEVLHDLQKRLESSEAERKQLQAELQTRRTESVCLNNAEISENGSDLSQKLKETQSKYEEAMKEVLSVQKQMKLGLVSPESVDTYSHLHELRITEEEMDVLKRDLQGALEESERNKEKVRELEEKLAEREKEAVIQPPREEYEEMKSSYCTVIENMNKEKAFLFEKYQN